MYAVNVELMVKEAHLNEFKKRAVLQTKNSSNKEDSVISLIFARILRSLD